MKAKLYVVADILTMLRFAFAALIIQAIIFDMTVGWYLITFGVGMATDAFDGIFARKGPRPVEENDYFWAIADQVADMILLASGAFYFVIRFMPEKLFIPSIWGILAIAVVAIIAGYIQIVRNKNTPDGEDHKEPTDPKLKRVIFWRRIGFVTAIVFLIDIVIFFGVDFIVALPMGTKLILVALTIVLTIIGAYLKRDRLKEDKTPIIRDGRACYPSKRKWLSVNEDVRKKTRIFFVVTIILMLLLGAAAFFLSGFLSIIIAWIIGIIIWIILSLRVIHYAA